MVMRRIANPRQCRFKPCRRLHFEDIEMSFCFSAEDVRVDTFRVHSIPFYARQGAEGIRLTHKPTGVIVEYQEGRSTHMNRHRAFQMLHDILFKHYFYEMSDLRS